MQRIVLAVGFLAIATLTAACNSPPPQLCTPSNCAGCCLGDTCRDGVTTDACGPLYGMCDVCVATQVCSSSGRCEFPGSAGGGTGGAAGGAAGVGGGVGGGGVGGGGVGGGGVGGGGVGGGGVGGGGVGGGGPTDAGFVGCNLSSTGNRGVYESCNTNADCAAGSECLNFPGAGLFCFRCCDGSGTSGPTPGTCERQTACVQSGGARLPLALRHFADHCFKSNCGPGAQNGSLRGSCQVGKDLWNIGATTFEPGICLPRIDSLGIGDCQQTGTLSRLAPCLKTFAVGAQRCGPGLNCIDFNGTPAVCRELCDPTATANPCATPGNACVDISAVDAQLRIGTYGYCVPGEACSLFEDSPCAKTVVNQGTTYATSCQSTTAARPSGWCNNIKGTQPQGATCDTRPAAAFNAALTCDRGMSCGANNSIPVSVCLNWCDTQPGSDGGSHPCDAGACQRIIFSPGPIVSAGYGACQ